ncbi:transposase [Streptomyces lavendulae]|uniref:transposase n=1 Tax=Streptomyces lavendulae TaxID=1914 RepID=UPI0033DDBEAE
MGTERAVEVWSGWFEEFFASMAWVFGRVDRRRTAMAYLKALIAPVERKNGWQIAEHVGHATPDRVQWFLSRSMWVADQLRDCVGSFVVARPGRAGGVHLMPGYSPELNPDEILNADIKRHVHPARAGSAGDLAHETRRFLHRRQKQPHHVRSYFHARHVRYTIE